MVLLFANFASSAFLLKKFLVHFIILKSIISSSCSGPYVVICDEGHLLKNSKSGIRNAVVQIASKRRVVLTGTPLQNNLKECEYMLS